MCDCHFPSHLNTLELGSCQHCLFHYLQSGLIKNELGDQENVGPVTDFTSVVVGTNCAVINYFYTFEAVVYGTALHYGIFLNSHIYFTYKMKYVNNMKLKNTFHNQLTFHSVA